MTSILSTQGYKVILSAIRQSYADALNAGTVQDLDAPARAEIKRLLESGAIVWSASGRWIVL